MFIQLSSRAGAMVAAMEKKQVVVVGGGVAGCTAAIEAAKLGLDVTLVDEHPQSLASMGLDAPYFYGAGLPNIISNCSLMAQSIFGSNELMAECFECGVDVLAGTCVWGSFRPGENSLQLTSGQLGLADEKRSWMIAYDHMILAPGARDLVLPFARWNLPGVAGACGGSALLDRYQVFEGENIVILGSGNLALRTARSALRAGLRVSGIVEVAPALQGDPALAAELKAAGIIFYPSHTVLEAIGKLKVEGIRIAQVDDRLTPVPNTEIDIACDSICMAFGAVPNIELAAVTGCEIEFDAARGGWIPATDRSMETTQGSVFAVGEGAMVSEAMFIDPALAMEQARRAARAIAQKEGLPAPKPGKTNDPGTSLYPPWAWHRSLVNAGGLDVMACQCEDVSRREFLDLSPPRYLGSEVRRPNGGLAGLSENGQTSQDLVKRLTRAGMGHCQGKRCRDHCVMLLADHAACELSAIRPASYRVPVRPLSLSVLWADDETEETRRDWRTWIHAADGIPEI
jgi:NADPH-dependent 2,4-dienoyl-CoA reductase/sulfur reductase-like enzyme